VQGVPQDRTGLLIIRTWIEAGSDVPLRAYIRSTGDVAAGFADTPASTLTDVDAIGALVQEWLQGVLSQQ